MLGGGWDGGVRDITVYSAGRVVGEVQGWEVTIHHLPAPTSSIPTVALEQN